MAVETARQKKADERAARMTVREAQKAEQQEMKALFQELPIEMPASTVKLDMVSTTQGSLSVAFAYNRFFRVPTRLVRLERKMI